MEYFIDRYASKAGKKIRSINKNTVELFQSYSWPGNVRELQNVIERSLIFCDTETFSVGQINMEYCLSIKPKTIAPENSRRKGLTNELDDILDATQLENLERQNILKALNRCDWRISGKNGAAKLLGIPPTTLSSRMKGSKNTTAELNPRVLAISCHENSYGYEFSEQKNNENYAVKGSFRGNDSVGCIWHGPCFGRNRAKKLEFNYEKEYAF